MQNLPINDDQNCNRLYIFSNSGIIFNEFKLNQIRKNNKSYSIKVTFMSNLRATYS